MYGFARIMILLAHDKQCINILPFFYTTIRKALNIMVLLILTYPTLLENLASYIFLSVVFREWMQKCLGMPMIVIATVKVIS